MNGNGDSPHAPAPGVEQAPAPPARRWYHFAGSVVFALFCIELGVLLVLAPWLDLYEHNFLLLLRPQWRSFLLSHQFRGALSGVGFLNFIVAFSEFADLAKRSAGRR